MKMLGFADRFRAGVVSDELRNALGMGQGGYSGDVASIVDYPFFWRMREYGFPPGYEIPIAALGSSTCFILQRAG